MWMVGACFFANVVFCVALGIAWAVRIVLAIGKPYTAFFLRASA